MKDRIIEMLERGDNVKLEFADKHGFLNQDQEYEHEREAIANSSLVVTKIVDDGMAICLEDTHYYIPEDDYKYFKIKEPKRNFNDFIDAVVQAYKDGIIPSLHLESLGVRSVRFLDAQEFDQHDDYSCSIDHIKSLYTETFVIESEEDLCRFSARVDSIVLANGVDIIDEVYFHQGVPYFSTLYAVKVPYSVLKGATVTQKRGNQCSK